MTVTARAVRIKLILFDVDGVLTDGKILVHGDGTESKVFDIKDGTGIVWARRAGLSVGLLSARSSMATEQRATQLGITLIRQGVANKLDAYNEMRTGLGLTDEQVAYMGDDVLDLPVLSRAGLSAAPADAVEDVRSRVDWVSGAKGGHGAARELVEVVLRAQGTWTAILDEYAAGGQPRKQRTLRIAAASERPSGGRRVGVGPRAQSKK